QAWRLVSYQFVHSGYFHIFSNVLIALMYGAPIELVHGHAKLLVVYNLGVTLGALTCAFSDPARAVVGASGGVYTLIGLHTADVCLNFDAMQSGLRRVVRTALCLLVPVTDLLVYVLVVKSTDTSYSAHIGGWIGGFLLGCAV
ncbi:peptidase S54, rhomboid domain-containing protein, partial [Pelagophyceae sp. CCMP2097]